MVGMKRWIRPLVVTSLLLFSGFLLYVAADRQGKPAEPFRQAGINRVFPQPGDVSVRQDAFGAELSFGYSGRLAIDNRPIPDDQTDTIPGINRLSFSPGPGKEIESLDEGRHCVTLTYWQSARGEETAGRPFSWCFTAA